MLLKVVWLLMLVFTADLFPASMVEAIILFAKDFSEYKGQTLAFKNY